MAVIPSGTSEPWFWAAREAAANDALTRLFYSLIAKREDRERTEALRRELFELQKAHQFEYQDRGFRHAETMQGMRDNPQAKPDPGYLRGTGSGPRAPSTAPAAVAPKAPGFGGGGAGFGPPVGKFSQSGDQQAALQSMAQADDTDTDDEDNSSIPFGARPTGYTGAPTTEEFSAQKVQTPKNKPVSPKYTPGQVARPPKKSRYVDQTYAEIDPGIISAWAASEKKYGLPRGILQTTMGLTHDGGRELGPEGWFGFSPQLQKTWSVRPEETQDPIRMGEYAARNAARNIKAYNVMAAGLRAKGLDVPDITGKSAAEVPLIALLSRTGVDEGPRIVAQLRTNPNAPLHSVLSPGVNPDGSQGDPARRVVSEFGLPSDASVNDLYVRMRKDIIPYHERTIRMDDQAPQSEVNDDANAPIPPKGVGAGDPYEYLISRGLTKQGAYTLRREFAEKLANLAQRGEAATGQKVSFNNGYRTPEEQAQIRADAKGVNVYWNNVKYTPNPNSGRRGIKAAGPGKSNHQDGTAADVNHGPVRNWMRAHMSGSGLRTISGDDPHVELDIPKRIGMARPRDTHPDTGAPATATASVQQPAATAAATTPSSAAAPLPSMQGAVNTFGANTGQPVTTTDSFAGRPSGPSQVAQALLPGEAVPMPQPKPGEAKPAMPADASSAVAIPTPQTAPAATAKAPTAAPLTPPSAAVERGDPNRQVALDERGPAPTTLSGDNRQAALDERGLPPASVGPMGLVSEPRPDPQQEDIIARRTADANAPRTDRTVAQAFAPKGIGTILDRLTGDKDILPSNQGVDEAGYAEFGQSLPNQPGTGVNDIIQWIKQKAAEYGTAREADRTTQKWQEDEPLRARMRGPITTNPPYDPGYLDPEKRKAAEEAIFNRRVANPPPDTQGGGYSPGHLDPREIEEERIRMNENAADRLRAPVQNVDPASKLNDVVRAIFGGGTEASVGAVPSQSQLPTPPQAPTAAPEPAGMEQVDDRGELSRVPNEQQSNLQMPAMIRATQAPPPVQAPQPQVQPQVQAPQEAPSVDISSYLNIPHTRLNEISVGDAVEALRNLFKREPKIDTSPPPQHKIRTQELTPGGEVLTPTQSDFMPSVKTTGAPPTAIPGGVLSGGGLPAAPLLYGKGPNGELLINGKPRDEVQMLPDQDELLEMPEGQ